MASLKDAALAYRKRDITTLKEIPVSIEVKQGDYQGRPYNYIELDGFKYAIKAEVLEQIKEVITYRPTTTKIKVVKNEKGEFKVVPID